MERRQGICLFFLERTEKERGAGKKKKKEKLWFPVCEHIM